MSKIPDKLLINLNILNKIQKNGRICRSSDGIISLDTEMFYQPIKRALNNDSRKQSILEIVEIINEAHEKIKEIINSKYMSNSSTEEYYNNCELLLLLYKSLKNSVEGINNLKFTYINDYNIICQVEIILVKINTILKETIYKFNYFNNQLVPEQRINNDYCNTINTDSVINMSTYV